MNNNRLFDIEGIKNFIKEDGNHLAAYLGVLAIGFYVISRTDMARNSEFYHSQQYMTIDSLHTSQRDSLDKAHHLQMDSLKKVYDLEHKVGGK